MARGNYNAKNNASKAKAEKEIKIDENINLTLYEWKDECSAKIALCNAFAIYAKIRMNKNGTFFLSYPSYKTNKGEFKNVAFCFSKEIGEAINAHVNEFMNEDE